MIKKKEKSRCFSYWEKLVFHWGRPLAMFVFSLCFINCSKTTQQYNYSSPSRCCTLRQEWACMSECGKVIRRASAERQRRLLVDCCVLGTDGWWPTCEKTQRRWEVEKELGRCASVRWEIARAAQMARSHLQRGFPPSVFTAQAPMPLDMTCVLFVWASQLASLAFSALNICILCMQVAWFCVGNKCWQVTYGTMWLHVWSG